MQNAKASAQSNVRTNKSGRLAERREPRIPVGAGVSVLNRSELGGAEVTPSNGVEERVSVASSPPSVGCKSFFRLPRPSPRTSSSDAKLASARRRIERSSVMFSGFGSAVAVSAWVAGVFVSEAASGAFEFTAGDTVSRFTVG